MLYAQSMSKQIEREIDLFALNIDSKPEVAFYHIDKAYKQSVALQQDSLIARSLYNLGYYYYLQNNRYLSKVNCNQAIAYSRKIKYYKILASSYNQLGMLAADMDKFDQSLKYYLSSLEIVDVGKLPELKSKVLLNLGNLYMFQKDTLKGLEYYEQNIINAKKNGLYNELAKGYITVAMIYATSDKAKTLNFYQNALRIVQKNSDFATAFIIHTNMSNFYLDSPRKEDVKKAYKHIQESAKIQRILKDDTLLFFVYFNFGGYYLTKKQFDQALVYYQKALFLSSKNITSDQKLNLYKYISTVYTYKNDYKSAYSFQEKYKNLNDSIFTINKNIAFHEIQTKYEVEKKNLKIDLLNKEKIIERSKKQTVIFISLAITIGLLILTFFYRNKNKLQKIINEKEQELFLQEKIKLENEHEIDRILGVLEGQATERDRIASEIHDGIGGELAGIKLYLSRINASINNENILVVINRLTGLFQELRNISHNLSSNFLKDKDFNIVLLDLKKEYENRNEFEMDIVIYPEDTFKDLKETLKHHLYRIIQELLANISKHAKAKKVAITITQHEDFINIIVEDDGIGFKTTNTSGIGLKNIQDRLKSFHGTLTIESLVSKGSFIIIDIPLQIK